MSRRFRQVEWVRKADRAGLPPTLYKPKARSRITNGVDLLPDIDQRNTWVRRYRDLVALFAADTGLEPESLSQGQRALVRRMAALCTELELMETRFAKNGGSKPDELEIFARVSSSLRRMCESLGIHRGRIPKQVNAPSVAEYLRQRRAVIDAEPAE
jgi:hypothetical protein